MVNAAKGRLQKRGVERDVRGLIEGSKEVKRSGVILGSTCKKLSFEEKGEGWD